MRISIPQAVILVALGLSPLPSSAAGTSILRGHWEGAFSRQGSIQLIALDFSAGEELDTPWRRLAGTFDMPELGLFGVPLDSLAATDSTVAFKLLYGKFRMLMHPADLQMTGENRDWGPPVSLHLRRVSRPAMMETVGVTVRRAGATLQATLYLPRAKHRVPTVIVAGGSIQTTRDFWEYRSWGPVLAGRGIATLVYDRRGQGASGGDSSDVDLKTEAADVIAFLAHLRRRPDIDPNRIGLIGLSRGGWVASWAAASSRDVKFIVLECAPAVSVTEQEIQRIERTAVEDSVTSDDVANASRFTHLMIRAALDSLPWQEAERAARSACGTRWAKLVQIPDSRSDLDWWQRNEYDQAAVLRRIRVPVLALFGALDRPCPRTSTPNRCVAPSRRAATPMCRSAWCRT